MSRTPPRRPDHEERVPFRRMPAVRWYRPSVVLNAGYRALTAQQLGVFLDKREMQASRPQRVFDAATGRDEVWFDYVADTGDGWNATFSVLEAVAEPSLHVQRSDGTAADLERGELLVFGGDEVYPTATATEYERRLLGPMTSAWPWAPDPAPRVFAIPGNHDWYDGLTSFLRTFANAGRSIGAWRTEQTRSYFAIELPHGWKLWGIDISLDSYIDSPQMEYFEAVPLNEGDKVILLTPVPAWVREAGREHTSSSGRRVGDNLRFFERRVIGPTGARLMATIAGDLHHYARYTERSTDGRPTHRITAGGGGAFLHPTHQLPDSLQFADPTSRAEVPYDLAATYPDADTSRRLGWFGEGGPFAILLRNRRFFWFMAAFSLLMVASLIASTVLWSGLEYLTTANVGQLAAHLVAPPAIVMTGVLLGVTIALAEPRPSARFGRLERIVSGLMHGGVHLAALACLTAAGAGLVPADDAVAGGTGLGLDAALYCSLVLIGVSAAAGLVTPLLLGFYLTASNALLGTHANLSFSAKSHEDHKCFLRCRVTSGGDLEIWPLAVDRVGRTWKLNRPPSDGARLDDEAPWFVAGDEPASAPRLIEDPIVLRGTGTDAP